MQSNTSSDSGPAEEDSSDSDLENQQRTNDDTMPVWYLHNVTSGTVHVARRALEADVEAGKAVLLDHVLWATACSRRLGAIGIFTVSRVEPPEATLCSLRACRRGI